MSYLLLKVFSVFKRFSQLKLVTAIILREFKQI